MTKDELRMVELISKLVNEMEQYSFETSALREVIYGNADEKTFQKSKKEIDAFLGYFETIY